MSHRYLIRPANFRRSMGCWLAACLLSSLAIAMASPARAQIVAVVNGAPVTALDIEQRMKLTQVTTGKPASRQQALNDLIDDQLKIFIAKRYAIVVTASEIDSAFENMAKRARLGAKQMEQSLTARGVALGSLKHKIQADLAWSQLVRGKFGSSLQIGDIDIARELKTRNIDEKDSVGFIYRLYPILVILPRDPDAASIDLKRREAENLRARFHDCTAGLKLARALRNVVVRDAVTRTSADFPPALREILRGMELGEVTKPEVTPQGIEMFALCDKKQSNADAPNKSEVRNELFAKRFEAESKKFLDEVRKQAMIEYK
jgi:peptidyl-prolyl cis-trans isomerase SurA